MTKNVIEYSHKVNTKSNINQQLFIDTQQVVEDLFICPYIIGDGC